MFQLFFYLLLTIHPFKNKLDHTSSKKNSLLSLAEGAMDACELPLFEAKSCGKGRTVYRLVSVSIFVSICLAWVYRATHIPVGLGGKGERWAWLGMFAAELWFGFYWVLTQALRWSPVHYSTFKHRLSKRFEKELPFVDVFVCTADPTAEPPLLVINTVLSAMAFNYPQEKLSVYLSDDGGSRLTFYALLEAIEFSKHWIPFTKKFKIEPRSPSVYFSSVADQDNMEITSVKNLYKEMEDRIATVVKQGIIHKELSEKHSGFSDWRSVSKPNDHHTILQILIDGGDSKAVDNEGHALPTVIYLSREKRPNHPHNFKAGALNALIRVSAAITNAPIILNLDCDMYSNNSEVMRDAVCFFMDDAGDDICYVQLPQNFMNITKNNIYGDPIKAVNEVEIPGMNAYGGPSFMGTGCFHRRESILGKKYIKGSSEEKNWKRKGRILTENESKNMLQEKARIYASCTYEENTQWGKEMGVKYGCPVEDVVTGLSIQCKGWRSIYFNPTRKGFLGLAPITLSQMLVQHKRWSEGTFQTFVSKYCPFVHGYGKIKLPLQMAYSAYLLFCPCSLPTLYYILVPSIYLTKNISLFPETSSFWCIPFAYLIFASYAICLVEAIWSGETVKGWWNMQRAWMVRRVVPYLYGFIDTLLGLLGFHNSAFVITAKVADEDVLQRYQREVMDFGPASSMFTLLVTVVIVELICFTGGVMQVVMVENGGRITTIDRLFFQFLITGMMVLVSLPIYEGLFFRRDEGRMPTSVTLKSIALAVFAFLLVTVLW